MWQAIANIITVVILVAFRGLPERARTSGGSGLV